MSQDPTISQDADERERARERSTERVRPPLEVPGYLFERFLGAGAYGEVWVATDRNTGRRVAVKFYTQRGGLDWSLLSREVEKLAFLFADRYVVQLIDVGWEATPPYYVMEYLERGSLADRLQSGPLTVEQAIGLFRDITVGLVHAHDKGVLHCDLKPGNVLLDQDDRPRLADFGQARLSHEQAPALGTLFYMAPEQADLQAVPDARWDVYALGAIFYCMLTGEPPIRSHAAMTEIDQSPDLATKLAAYRRLLIDAAPPTKHRRVPGVDRDLEEIIERCLTPSPAKRFPNPQAVLAALDSRNLRKARRPLLVLGALGPAVLLLILSWFSWRAYDTAVRESDDTLIRRALETNGFAAQFVAETVAAEIERRWRTLESEADDFDFRELLFKTAVGTAAVADRTALQRQLETMARDNPEVAASSWTILDAKGNQLARAPFDPNTVGQNFAYRDYFHGRGDQQPNDTSDVEPIRQPHLSNVFVSTATKERKVAFSVPVWSLEPDRAKRHVIGVLSVTVTLGQFAEMQAAGSDQRSQVAVLVDFKRDSEKQVGSILEHPHFRKQLAAKNGTEPLPAVHFDMKQLLAMRDALVEAAKDGATGRLQSDDYRDPVGGDYAGRWLAGFRPVNVSIGNGAVRDTGWVVIVQESFAEAVAPAQELGHKLVRYGLTALGVVIAVVTALWGFVMIVLNESPRFKLTTLLRRRAGLPATGVTGTASANAEGVRGQG